MKLVHAVFENGVFRPRECVELPEGSEVEFEATLGSLDDTGEPSEARIYELLSRELRQVKPTWRSVTTSPAMSGVFLDSVGLLALWNDSDQWHSAAEEAHRRLIERNALVWTTTLILYECGNRAVRRADFRSLAASFYDEMEVSGNLIAPTPDEERSAWTAYRRGEAGSAGIVDHVSFVVMRRLGLTEAFTSDAHFRAAGFETLF